MPSVRVVTWPELSESERTSLPAVHVLDGGPIWDEKYLRRIHRGPSPFVDYHAVYAVEKDEVLGFVQVIRTPFRFVGAPRPETVAGLDYVVVRPEALRRGLASQLIQEVHRRERSEGTRWVLLSTRRSWGAHRLYEQLGYRDVYSPVSVLRQVPARAPDRLARGYRIRRARAKDASGLERLLRESERGRSGFVPRSPDSFSWRFRHEWARPRDHHLLLHQGREVGYARISVSPRAVTADEVALTGPDHALPMLLHLEREARGRWLLLQRTTFASDLKGELLARGYRFYPYAHATIMACPIAPGLRGVGAFAPWQATFEDPSFVMHAGDWF